MDSSLGDDTPLHLKGVSRVKHTILLKYLPPWSTILGSAHRRLAYFDCYAGPGIYEFAGQPVDGSPIIALKTAKDYISRNKGKELVLAFVEKDDKTRSQLERCMEVHYPLPAGLYARVFAEDATDFVDSLLAHVPNLVPSFFMVDPYGHPLTVPVLNEILRRPRTEALINFMYFSINRDLNNPKAQGALNRMFGDTDWQTQAFLRKNRREREEDLLAYFCRKIDASYKFPFRILYDPEDRMSRKRTKYYLIHASNHPKAVLLMKEVMWPLGDEEGIYQYGGIEQQPMFTMSPSEEQLRTSLLREFGGREVTFDGIREATWQWPFVEKHYRSVVQVLEKDGLVRITRVSSKRTGIKQLDRVYFPPSAV